MSMHPEPEPHFRDMNDADLDAVMAIENVIYTHPWTRGNFADSLDAGSKCWVMECGGAMVGYAVLNLAAGEAHLLNLSIAATSQRRGLGAAFLLYLFDFIKKNDVQALFLEVRESNVIARRLYMRAGFHQIGVRRGYYPAYGGREDAIVLEYKP